MYEQIILCSVEEAERTPFKKELIARLIVCSLSNNSICNFSLSNLILPVSRHRLMLLNTDFIKGLLTRKYEGHFK